MDVTTAANTDKAAVHEITKNRDVNPDTIRGVV